MGPKRYFAIGLKAATKVSPGDKDKKVESKEKDRAAAPGAAVSAEIIKISSTAISKAKHRQAKQERFKKKRHTPKGSNDRRPAKQDRYPGRAPVDPERLARHDRGSGVDVKRVKGTFARRKQEQREQNIEQAVEIAARTELLLNEDHGVLEGDDVDEFTANVSQTQIKNAVDEESAAKGFELNLQQFGPYKIDYTRNGRFLLLGGRRGHVAAFDWISKKLFCEINVQEVVNDVKWLHTENFYAVAQKRWTYIYDNQGIEIHCLKRLDNVKKLDYLPYHFLLTSLSDRGFLSWVDVSMGKLVRQMPANLGHCSDMCQNPWNAVLCLGHSRGVVSMWTPNSSRAVAKMLAHRQAVTAVAVDATGKHMATAAVDRKVRIWDVRQFRCLHEFQLSDCGVGASRLAFSGRGMLGAAVGDSVKVLKDVCRDVNSGVTVVKRSKPRRIYPYMSHKANRTISDLQFAPYEDVLGVGHAGGFASLLIPGSADPNFDAFEVNPYQSKSQRREAEVKALLEKIQPELIALDPEMISQVDVPSLQNKVLEKSQKLYIKPPKVDFEPRTKTKGKGGAAKRFYVKRSVQEEARRADILKKLEEAQAESRAGPPKKKKPPKSLLDRLK